MPLLKPITDPATRITRLLVGQEARFQRAFFLAIQTITDQTTLNVLANLLAAGRFEEALVALEAAAAVLGGTYGASLTAAADDTARFLSSALTVNVAFDVSNFRAVDAIRQNSLRLIREFVAEQRRATREALADGIARGLNPRQQARVFRGSIGLTQKQVQTTNNFRALLTTRRADGLPSREVLTRALRDGRFDRTIQRALREGEPLTQRQVDRMVDRYRQRQLKNRSETIARTEALRSVHQGSEEMYRQAIDMNQLEPRQLSRKWVTARDDRVRGSHVNLNGEVRGLDETFQGTDGELRFPGDPAAPGSETIQCRCAIATRLE